MNLSPEERQRLSEYTTDGVPNVLSRRAQVLLLYAEGLSTSEVARQAHISPGRARYWRGQYQRRGMGIFNRHRTTKAASEVIQEPAPDAGPADAPELKSEAKIEAVKKPARKKRKDNLSTPQAVPQSTEAAGDLPLPVRRDKTGLLAGDRMAEAGRKVLLFQFAEMLAHEEGTRQGEDIEELHDMRVATRRMRAAFEIFSPFYEPRAIKKNLKGLRATGRALGRVRDLDVFMEKAQMYLETLPETDRQGLEPLLHAWADERDKDRQEMLTYLDSPGYAEFKQRFNRFLQTPGAGALPADPVTPDHVREVVPVLIYTRLAAVRAYEPVLPNARIEQLHALRIEFKKLRYALEFFREVLGSSAKDVINDIKKMQDHLGDLNDADVATAILRQVLDGWDARQAERPLAERQNPEAIVAYLAYRHAERHHLMVSFSESWDYFMRPEFRAALAEAVAVL